jgi:hypothetical protein
LGKHIHDGHDHGVTSFSSNSLDQSPFRHPGGLHTGAAESGRNVRRSEALRTSGTNSALNLRGQIVIWKFTVRFLPELTQLFSAAFHPHGSGVRSDACYAEASLLPERQFHELATLFQLRPSELLRVRGFITSHGPVQGAGLSLHFRCR